MDRSNGYELIAESLFLKRRGAALVGIGTSAVREWCKTLTPGSAVLDLGCGSGLPISKALSDEGMIVYGVDAAPSMVKAFKQNFPHALVACEPVEDSLFFNRKFDAIIAWGLMFLLSEGVQATIIRKAGNALRIGGHFLFTAPAMMLEWEDAMTGRRSVSLGSSEYRKILSASGLSLTSEFEDEGENHYFNSIKQPDLIR